MKAGTDTDLSADESETLMAAFVEMFKEHYGEDYTRYCGTMKLAEGMVNLTDGADASARYVYSTVGSDAAYCYQAGWEVDGYWVIWAIWAQSKLDMRKIIIATGLPSFHNNVEYMYICQTDEANPDGISKSARDVNSLTVTGKAKYEFMPKSISGKSVFMVKDDCVSKFSNNTWVKTINWM